MYELWSEFKEYERRDWFGLEEYEENQSPQKKKNREGIIENYSSLEAT